jgi:signal transduction histidine kinase
MGSILGSASRLIFRRRRIGRAADDSRGGRVYRDGVKPLGIDPVRLDTLLAVVLTVSIELETWFSSHQPHHRVAMAVAGPLLTAAIAVRRRYPFAVGVGAGLWGVLSSTFFPANLATVLVAWPCDMYALAVWTPTRRFLIGLLAFTVPALVLLPFGPHSVSSGMQFLVISTVVILLVRRVVRDRERRADMAERERDLAAREAVVEVRARIARELHDAIAHNVSMMVVQAGAERRVLGDERSSTREVLETVEQIGRGALTEMRRLVGMLRSGGEEALAPQPGLGDLERLVGQVCEAGLPVDLQIEGERRELPVGLDLSAYRIVQEALTNALKHAGQACATVNVRYHDDSLELEIVDNGKGATPRVESGGHGLVGMRERVALYGGRFEASHRASGGFTVRVLLPIR